MSSRSGSSGSCSSLLLYLFLFGVARALIRDLRQAAREPGTEIGRLVVVTSPSGEPAAGSSIGLDAITTLGRDVNNAIVVDDQFASAAARRPHVPRPDLVRRGSAEHERHVRERRPGRGRLAARLRRRAPARPGPDAARAAAAMSESAAPMSAAAPALPGIFEGFRPRPRWRELKLLGDRRRGDPGRQRLARPDPPGAGARDPQRVLACRARPPARLPRRAARGAPRPGPDRPPDRPGPAARGRAARRDQPAAHGAAAPGPRRPALLRRGAGAGRGPARLAVAVDDPGRRRSRSSSAPTSGCGSTSTRGRPPASPCCC